MRTVDRNAILGTLLLSLGACIPLPNDLGGDDSPTTSETSTGGSSTTSTADPDDSVGDDPFEEEIRLDMNLDPLFPPCDEVEPSTVTVSASQTSKGPLPVAHAVYGWDHCCYVKPRLVLTVEPPAPEGFPVLDPPDYVEVIAFGTDVLEPGAPQFDGIHTGAFQDDGQDFPVGPEGTFRFFEPIDTTLIDGEAPNPNQRLHARVTLEAEGWDFDVEVEASYCQAYDLPDCACE